MTEDIPPIEKAKTTAHTVHGYWCSRCKKVVFAPVSDALPNAMIGLRLVVFTAWLHYLVGVSVGNIVRILSVVCRFRISAGGLTQAWQNLASLLEPIYTDIGQKISQSAVLSADETGWRLNGVTHWLWCFTTKTLAYYLITKSRGSPVIKNVLGTLFQGVLICDFWGAYNKISALAEQRCFSIISLPNWPKWIGTPAPQTRRLSGNDAGVVRAAVGFVGQCGDQLVIVVGIGLGFTGITRGLHAWRAAQRLDTDTGVISQRGQAAVQAGMARLGQAVFDKSHGSGQSGTLNCDCGTASIPSGARMWAISRQLAGIAGGDDKLAHDASACC